MRTVFFFIICIQLLIMWPESSKCQVYANAETHSVNGLCIACGITNPENSTDANYSNYETMNLTVSVLGANVKQKLHFPVAGNPGEYAGIVVENATPSLLSISLMGSVTLTTYLNGVSTNDPATSTGLSLSALGSSTQYKMEFRATKAFDEIEVAFNAGIVGTLNNIRIYYAYHTTTGPLPIQLLSFSANAENNAVKLNWITASEQNNDYFTIEKSSDAINYEPVKEVNGSGTTSTKHEYNYEDNAPSAGINYYRLKQTDFNGKYSYSKVITAEYDPSRPGYSVYPNPCTGMSFIL